jgi:aspartyl-tRNA(Asn)/glutamyl-tRNA(Gln) amidotransferase subunit C
MAITREDVRHIALLARLQLSEAEEEAFTEQLDHILSHCERLQRLDTAGVEPTAHVVAMATPFREDMIGNAPNAVALLANAPVRDGRFFKVPKIIE